MKILISRLSALGDIACSLPAAGALKQSFPDSKITWLVDRRFSGLVECCSFVDQVVIVEKGLNAMIHQIRNIGEFDIGLDLQGLLKSALPIAISKSKNKFGYHWQREGARLLVSPVMPTASSIHIVEQYCDVARAAGGGNDIRFGLHTNSVDLSKTKEVLQNAGWDGKQRLVLANAGAGWAAKRWAPENYAALVNTVESTGAKMGFIGTKADEPAFSAVADAGGGNAMNLLGKTNVRELVSLLSMASVVVAGDTGALHIAAGLSRPCVGIYTHTRPERSCAFGQLSRCRDTDKNEVINNVISILEAQV